jgi:hypothetical protein
MVDQRLKSATREASVTKEAIALHREISKRAEAIDAARDRAEMRAADLVEQYLAPYERSLDEALWRTVLRGVTVPEIANAHPETSEDQILEAFERERRRRVVRASRSDTISDLNDRQKEILRELRELDLAIPQLPIDYEGALTESQQRYLETLDALVRKAVNADTPIDALLSVGLSGVGNAALEKSLSRSRQKSRWYMEYLLPIHDQ